MHQHALRARAGLTFLAALTAAAAVSAPPAQAASKAKLSAGSLGNPPAALTAAQRFSVKGTVKNTGRRSTNAYLRFKLRTTNGNATYAVGSLTVKKVKPKATRKYTAKLRAPAAADLGAARSMVLVVCVGRTKTDTAPVCRKAARQSRLAGTAPAPAPTPQLPGDRTAPTTTDDVTGERSKTDVSVTLTATDPGGSGVAQTFYEVGTSPKTPTTSSPTYDPARRPVLRNGEAIRYFSVDKDGNAEAPQTSVAAVVDPTDYVKAARSGGDTLFPNIGNGGYDATHYGLDLSYDIETKYLAGTTTMTATATQNLAGFSLDLAYWLRAQRVTVNGEVAAFDQGGLGTYKLDVTPETPVKAGQKLTVAVTYSGTEQAYIDPDGSEEGFVPDPVRGAIVVSEPVGAMGWYPNNNVPYDKAKYTIAVSVPTLTSGVPWSVVGPGVLTEKTVGAEQTKFVWDETAPTSSYLIGLGIGKYDVAESTFTPTSGPAIPFTTAVDSAFTTNKANIVAKLNQAPGMIDYFAEYYGVNYPYTSAGGIVPMQNVFYALETQSKPIYAGSYSATPTGAGPSVNTIAHESGHMWFGNYVSPTQWKDIWLNEGMTEFSSWLWQERQNAGTTLASRWTTNYDGTSTTFWNVAPADPPSAVDIFDHSAMYTRGAMTMIGIMDVVGEARYKELMKAWLTMPGHTYGNATTEQLIALVKEKDLAWRTADGQSDRTARWTEYFEQWLYTEYTGDPAAGNKPAMTAANFDTYPLT